MAKNSKTRKPMTDEEREQRRAAERELMTQAVGALMTSEGWQRWLTVRRHFHAYSFGNQLLIALQCPHATQVAGFKRWLTIGYCVRKGEKALRIWAPVPPSKKALQAWRENGSVPADRPRTHFRMTAVFDRSQVDEIPDFPGGALALTPPILTLEGEDLADSWAPLVALGEQIGSTVTREAIPGAADGFYEPATKRIAIRDTLPGNARVSTLVHELAHALVRADKHDTDPALSYAQEEVVAETVAYTVCSGLGFDTSGESVPYVASYAAAVGVDTIEKYAGLIDRLAKRIEDAVLTPSASVDASTDKLPVDAGPELARAAA